jgi:uncharacterized protein YcnI
MQHPPTTVRTATRRAARATLGTLAAGCTAGLVLFAAPGWAHVTVEPSTATQGGDAVLSFVVPTESDSASTTKVQVFMPQDHPIASVSVRPHPGWQVKVATHKLTTPLASDDGQVTEAVSSVTWTSDSPRDAIAPGQYEEFEVSAGPLPDVSSLTFKTLQTYSDGSIVRWIDPPAPAGQPEPEHPAPVVTLLPGSADAPSAGSGDGKATTALVLSIVAVVLGAGALGVSLVRRRAG